MVSRTKQVQLLLLPADELEVCEAIVDAYPQVRFLESVPWDSPDAPPVRQAITECRTGGVIWNPEIYSDLPVDIRSNGAVFGPQVGPVVQWRRSLENSSNALGAGRWAAGYSEATKREMVDFITGIWKILEARTTNKLRRPGKDGELVSERGYRVGSAALRRALEGSLTLRADQMTLVPE